LLFPFAFSLVLFCVSSRASLEGPTGEQQSTGVHEQPLDVKPGLWQVDLTVKYSGLPPQMQAMMDRLTPEQRAAMGLSAPKTYKTCVTAKNLNTPWIQGDNDCRWTVLKSTSSDLDVHGKSCRAGKNQGIDTELDMKIHAVDPEHVRATLHGTGAGVGNDFTMDGSYVGKWLGPSCPSDQN